MSFPLRWVRGLARADPAEVAARSRTLLREGPAVVSELEYLCLDGLGSLLDREDATEDEVAVTYIAAQFLDALSANVALLEQGRIRASISQLRAMIESRVVMEYVRGDQDRGRAWWKAEKPADRLRFSFEAAYHDSSIDPDVWKGLWEMCNEKVHTNYGGFPVQSRSRPICGGDTYIGPFYDPTSISNLFLMALALSQWFAQLLGGWYEGHPMFPADYAERLDRICSPWGLYAVELQRRAQAEHKTVEAEAGTMSLEDQAEADAILTEITNRRSGRDRLSGVLWIPPS